MLQMHLTYEIEFPSFQTFSQEVLVSVYARTNSLPL